MVLPEENAFWFMLMFSHCSLTRQQSKIEQVERFHAWSFFYLQSLSKKSVICFRLSVFLQLHLDMYVGTTHSMATAAPKTKAALIFPAVGLVVLANRERLFRHPSSLLAAFGKEEMLCECKILYDSGNRNQKFAWNRNTAAFPTFITAAVTPQQGLLLWEPLKAAATTTTRAREKSSTRRRIPPQVSADITSPSTLCPCGLWSHHEAPPWSHSLLSHCRPSIILYLIASTALLQQRYFLQLNICIPKSWHLPGQVPQSLHLLLLQWEDVPVNRRAHGASNQSDSSIWVYF